MKFISTDSFLPGENWSRNSHPVCAWGASSGRVLHEGAVNISQCNVLPANWAENKKNCSSRQESRCEDASVQTLISQPAAGDPTPHQGSCALRDQRNNCLRPAARQTAVRLRATLTPRNSCKWHHGKQDLAWITTQLVPGTLSINKTVFG